VTQFIIRSRCTTHCGGSATWTRAQFCPGAQDSCHTSNLRTRSGDTGQRKRHRHASIRPPLINHMPSVFVFVSVYLTFSATHSPAGLCSTLPTVDGKRIDPGAAAAIAGSGCAGNEKIRGVALDVVFGGPSGNEKIRGVALDVVFSRFLARWTQSLWKYRALGKRRRKEGRTGEVSERERGVLHACMTYHEQHAAMVKTQVTHPHTHTHIHV
jgi:hypothetical protein